MRLAVSILAILLSATPRTVRAQATPLTVAEAEAEGARFARSPSAAAVQSFGARPFRGTSERRCVAYSASEGSLPAGSLRSGEFLLRTTFTGPWALRAGHGQKMLWLPLHASAGDRRPLLIRAAQREQPSDSLGQTVAGLAHSRTEFGYPSTVQFPTPGEWMVVATAGADWGCFLLTVSP